MRCKLLNKGGKSHQFKTLNEHPSPPPGLLLSVAFWTYIVCIVVLQPDGQALYADFSTIQQHDGHAPHADIKTHPGIPLPSLPRQSGSQHLPSPALSCTVYYYEH